MANLTNDQRNANVNCNKALLDSLHNKLKILHSLIIIIGENVVKWELSSTAVGSIH